MKEKSITDQTARSKQDSQQCPSQEDWKAAINLKGGPLVGEIAEALLRIVEGEDLESCYSSLLEKVASSLQALFVEMRDGSPLNTFRAEMLINYLVTVNLFPHGEPPNEL